MFEKKYSRRQILKAGTAFMSSAALIHLPDFESDFGQAYSGSKALVLIHLSGGNDALNTVVPLNCPTYGRQRGSLVLGKDKVLKLDSNYGLNSALPNLHRFYKRGELALFLGAGYPESSMSHELSTHVWNQGDFGKASIDRFLADVQSKESPIGQSFWFDCPNLRLNSVVIGSPQELEEKVVTSYARSVDTVFHVQLDGFDTHKDQLIEHFKALSRLDNYFEVIDKLASRRDLCTLVYSEFGRSLFPNQTGGTDHGQGGLAILAGPQVKGGIYGDYQYVIDSDGKRLLPTWDFRSIYGALLVDWLETDSNKYERDVEKLTCIKSKSRLLKF